MQKRTRYTRARSDTAGTHGKLDRTASLETVVGGRVTVRPDGCWLYGDDPAKYRAVETSTRGAVLVHRFVYETLVGPIPDGMVLHHECETPACCNPAHLTPMTNGDHIAHHAALRWQLRYL